jgi:hypothetical protein
MNVLRILQLLSGVVQGTFCVQTSQPLLQLLHAVYAQGYGLPLPKWVCLYLSFQVQEESVGRFGERVCQQHRVVVPW